MSTRNQLAIVPQFMRDFACIGAACEDSCCVGWKVVIDEDTYKKYNRVRDKDLTFLMQKKVTRNRSTPTKLDYAKIKMNADGGCPFLDAEKLCGIQKKLGEEYLSHTCATYPRQTRLINETWEQSATVSCPEVARLALLNPNGIEFDEITDFKSGKLLGVPVFDTTDPKLQGSAQKYLWELRIFTITVLQDRSYSLDDRLIIIGMFYKKISELIADKQVDSIPGTIASYMSIVESGALREQLAEIPVQHNLQMDLIKAMTDERFRKGITNKRFMECYKETLAGLGYIAGAQYDDVAANYMDKLRQYYIPFTQDHDYIMENYLVNHVFKNVFPFGDHSNVFNEYVMLVVNYSIIKMLFIGVGAHHQGMTPELEVKVIQSFSRMFEHNKQFLTNLFMKLQAGGYTSMAYMSILIKN